MTHVRIGDWVFDNVDYDADRDVMYLTIGPPVRGYGQETPEGHILRFTEDDRFCGVTLVGIQGLLDESDEVGVTLPPKPKQETLPSTQIHRVLAAR